MALPVFVGMDNSSSVVSVCRRPWQQLGIRPDDRVAYIAPNTHAQLESFYAVRQIGAVLVPVNYRLTADDFTYVAANTAFAAKFFTAPTRHGVARAVCRSHLAKGLVRHCLLGEDTYRCVSLQILDFGHS
jgi:acyl-CoA synthetase (AMP-forming)/AMP-acid ligase II